MPHVTVSACSVDGCVKPVRSRSMCKGHYERTRLGKSLQTPLRRYSPGSICSVEACDRAYYGDGLCAFHYDRRRSGVPFDAPVRDGRIVDRKGYVLVRIPGYPGAYRGRYAPEHRLVMEQRLGRRLRPEENVHHINGRRDDNRPENLELWVTSQPSGQRVTDLLDWAHEIIRRYEA